MPTFFTDENTQWKKKEGEETNELLSKSGHIKL